MTNEVKNISVKKNYYRLLAGLAAFFVIAFILDFCVGSIFNHFYLKQTSGWEYRTKYAVEETKADILIFGASRAQQQYNPVFFEERLGQTCYNVGRDGEPIFYYYAVFKGIQSRYTPKMIILDIENGVFKEAQSSYDKLAVLLPFYQNHPEMRSILELRGPYEKLKLQSRIYPYNSLFFKIAIGNTKFSEKRNTDIKGYVPLTGALKEPIRTVDFSKPYAIDSNKVKFYRSFINDCKRLNIKLYIVCAPYFINSIGTDPSVAMAKEIAKENNIDFFDFSADQEFRSNSTLFDDTIHVNVAGSKLFTNKLVDTIISSKSK
ncbi:MAG: SGNH/GDSL hydrolase family protein [Ferruginibacter sp.]